MISYFLYNFPKICTSSGRISTAQNSALSSLITSKEVEHEMRAQALKRLAFIILSSELGQYQSQLPDIQGD